MVAKLLPRDGLYITFINTHLFFKSAWLFKGECDESCFKWLPAKEMLPLYCKMKEKKKKPLYSALLFLLRKAEYQQVIWPRSLWKYVALPLFSWDLSIFADLKGKNIGEKVIANINRCKKAIENGIFENSWVYLFFQTW